MVFSSYLPDYKEINPLHTSSCIRFYENQLQVNPVPLILKAGEVFGPARNASNTEKLSGFPFKTLLPVRPQGSNLLFLTVHYGQVAF